MDLATFIVLLRGINVSGRNMIPMAELRVACAELGWRDVQSYIQSGNLILRAEAAPAELEGALEGEIKRRFALTIPVIARAAADWPAYIASNPFHEESQREPSLVMLGLAKAAPKSDAGEQLQARAQNGERIAQVGDAIWAYYPQGAGRSKLSPALFDRLSGAPVTARNWRTVLKLGELAQ